MRRWVVAVLGSRMTEYLLLELCEKKQKK